MSLHVLIGKRISNDEYKMNALTSSPILNSWACVCARESQTSRERDTVCVCVRAIKSVCVCV